MKNKIVLIGLLFGVFTSQAHSATSTVAQYQNLVETWLGLRAQERALVQDWQQHKGVLEQRLQLLKQEKKLLKQTLLESRSAQNQVDVRRAELLKTQSELETAQSELATWLDFRFRAVHSTLNQLPPPLVKNWSEQIAANGESKDNSERLDLLLTLYRQRDEFNSRVSYLKSMVAINGDESILIEQIYLGGQIAYFSTPDGSKTGLGYVANNQWVWLESDLISEQQFRLAKAMLDHQVAAELIPLPVNVEQTK